MTPRRAALKSDTFVPYSGKEGRGIVDVELYRTVRRPYLRHEKLVPKKGCRIPHRAAMGPKSGNLSSHPQ